MIPSFEESGVLPPFVGDGPTSPANQAPYKVSLSEFVEHFSTSDERLVILKGFLTYRAKLKAAGIVDGFQWVDGSFVENVEKIRQRAPNDIDLVTFAHKPVGFTAQDWRGFVQENTDLFQPREAKKHYKCDAYFVDLALPPRLLVSRTSYWFGLFSHQRETSLWKGMLEIDLSCDEAPILKALENGGYNAS